MLLGHTFDEQWRPVADQTYGHLYEVSNHGRVRTTKTGKIRRTPITSTGYVNVILCAVGKLKNFAVHRLVASAFLGVSALMVNHKDGNKSNNYVNNLEYVTAAGNSLHRCRVLHKCVGEAHGMAKLSEADVRLMRELFVAGMSKNKLSKRFGVDRATVRRAIEGKTWAAVA